MPGSEGNAYKWVDLAAELPGRNGKQVSKLYTNRLAAHLVKGKFTRQEDALLVLAQQQEGNEWRSE